MTTHEFLDDLIRTGSALALAELRRPVEHFDLAELDALGSALDSALDLATVRARTLLAEHQEQFPASPLFSDIQLFAPMGLGRRETAVTQVLAWLCHPSASHGLGTKFLCALLRGLESPVDLAERIGRNEYVAIGVHAEFRPDQANRADIVITGHGKPGTEPFCLVIEAKVDAAEGMQQSERYIEAFSRYCTDTRFFFLTLDGIPAESSAFISAKYTSLARQFLSVLPDCQGAEGFEYARYFVADVLAELCGVKPSSRLSNLLRNDPFALYDLLGKPLHE